MSRVFMAPAKGVPLELCNGGGAQKNYNYAPTWSSKTCDDMYIRKPASVAQVTETQCAREESGFIPGSAGRFRVRITGAHASRLISRAGSVRRCPL